MSAGARPARSADRADEGAVRALRLDESTTMASAEAPETLVLIAAGGERVEAPAAAALACTTVRHAFDDAGGPDEPAIRAHDGAPACQKSAVQAPVLGKSLPTRPHPP